MNLIGRLRSWEEVGIVTDGIVYDKLKSRKY